MLSIYLFFIGTDHLDPNDLVSYRTVDALEEEKDPNINPAIVTYRRIVKPSGQLLLVPEEED